MTKKNNDIIESLNIIKEEMNNLTSADLELVINMAVRRLRRKIVEEAVMMQRAINTMNKKYDKEE
jgi:hypothetical protein